ncbi:two-component sensor histidine kinase [Gelidibacter sediminis]|uniref:Two-component sensor histidine kinase n=1 Tax=Gelidibacter sediminis TaxID=1608710 RepID=A0A4R7Q1R0_9FLAO|nr:sensor histidine kinase [Gelidibacter sediminis]TDU40441.1 two-component sensor histidine kinase [Gelidibacter sediminis]
MKISKSLITIVFVLILGGLLLQQLISTYQELERKKIQNKLEKTHSDAMIRAKAGIDVYATLVSSLKSHIKNTPIFPTEIELQNYLNDLLGEIKFNDSIVVSYIDPTHVFKYVVAPNAIDAPGLKGVSLIGLLDKERIEALDELMTTDDIRIFTPINLREGWVGFPFNFTVHDKQNNVLGYMAPVINAKYLLDYFYEGDDNEEFAHKFIVKDTVDLTREVVYNKTTIYNKTTDPEYYKNFKISEADFIYSNINVFGLNLKIGSAYKQKPEISNTIAYLAYLWYFIISLSIIIIFYLFLKNKRLNRDLNLANTQINSKNAELEKSLFKIQTLIKEIHHRVKNNMQMISGILSLQQDESTDEAVKSALEQSKSRIHSMALVHEKLYGSVSLKDIKTKEYTEQLLDFVEEIIGVKDLNLKKTIKIDDDLIFDGDTTSNLGLILNELVANSYKHAFKMDKVNTLEISIFKDKDHFILVYSDNGSGLPENYNFKESESLGIQLILILADQLNGEMNYSNDDKSTFKIHFKPIEISFSE